MGKDPQTSTSCTFLGAARTRKPLQDPNKREIRFGVASYPVPVRNGNRSRKTNSSLEISDRVCIKGKKKMPTTYGTRSHKDWGMIMYAHLWLGMHINKFFIGMFTRVEGISIAHPHVMVLHEPNFLRR